jgi:formylmethanofuran dehydrogenase subunit B
MSSSGGPQTLQDTRLEHVTCLGCGCACDDIAVRVQNNRIVEAERACPLGRDWFGDGHIPAAIRVGNTDASLDTALDAVVTLLASAAAPLVYLAAELSCEAQREVVALADVLHASLDTISSDTVLPSLLATQERGRASATLGEIRNRADVLMFWGVDPNVRYPRYWSRYAPEPPGLHVDGRKARTIVAVDVEEFRGPIDADVRVAVDARDEVALLTTIAAAVVRPDLSFDEPIGTNARSVAAQLIAARYSVIVADAEPDATDGSRWPARDPQRTPALIALAHALNGSSRCALSTLRAGGNRSGAEAVLTSQTGYPTGVDFSRGFPVYRPHDAKMFRDAALIVGDPRTIPPAVMSTFTDRADSGQLPLAIVGPGASRVTSARVAIDTGVAGIHCSGTALRMDDLALPLRPSVAGHRDPADLMRALITRLSARDGFIRGAPDAFTRPAGDGPEDPSLRDARSWR